jgi:hypothetical protein
VPDTLLRMGFHPFYEQPPRIFWEHEMREWNAKYCSLIFPGRSETSATSSGPSIKRCTLARMAWHRCDAAGSLGAGNR